MVFIFVEGCSEGIGAKRPPILYLSAPRVCLVSRLVTLPPGHGCTSPCSSSVRFSPPYTTVTDTSHILLEYCGFCFHRSHLLQSTSRSMVSIWSMPHWPAAKILSLQIKQMSAHTDTSTHFLGKAQEQFFLIPKQRSFYSPIVLE